jgi:hypothetical protein
VAKEKLQRGQAYQDNDLVCPWHDGRIWKPNSFTPPFRKFIRRTSLPRVSFHELRHSHVTQLMSMGINP